MTWLGAQGQLRHQKAAPKIDQCASENLLTTLTVASLTYGKRDIPLKEGPFPCSITRVPDLKLKARELSEHSNSQALGSCWMYAETYALTCRVHRFDRVKSLIFNRTPQNTGWHFDFHVLVLCNCKLVVSINPPKYYGVVGNAIQRDRISLKKFEGTASSKFHFPAIPSRGNPNPAKIRA